MQFIEKNMKERMMITDKELEILNNIIYQQKNEMIFSSFEVYLSNKDEEDFMDTIKRILQKIRSRNLEEKTKENIKENNMSNSDNTKASYFKEKPTKKSEELNKLPEKNEKNSIKNKEKIIEKNCEKNNEKNIEKNNEKTIEKTVEKPFEKPAERSKNTEKNKKNMLDMIFKTFFEETEEEFEPIEIGFAKNLYDNSNEKLIHVLNTCETIPKAVIEIKELAIKAYMSFMKENFENRQIDYILKGRNERSSEICSIIHVI